MQWSEEPRNGARQVSRETIVTTDEQYYFRSRAEEEMAIAFESTDQVSADIHRSLAKLYLAKVADSTSVEQQNCWSSP